jgi:hypothetical protein
VSFDLVGNTDNDFGGARNRIGHRNPAGKIR